MTGIHDFGLFLVTGILLNITPGQDTLYIIGRTAAHGRTIGIASALGISTGSLIHTAAAALGLSVIIAASTTAFVVLKLVGAAYLIYLGIGLLRARKSSSGLSARAMNVGAMAAFRQGVLTNVTNPKVALFFLAFLPQFISPESPSKVLPFLLLGLTFVATGTVWCVILAFAADYFRNVFARSAWSTSVLSRACGALFIALGLRLAMTKP